MYQYQHELRMHLGSGGCTVVSTLSQKRQYFGNKVTEKKLVCFDFPLQISSKTFHIVTKNERDVIKCILGFSKSDCKEN